MHYQVQLPELGAITIKKQLPVLVYSLDVEEVIMGCVLPAGLKQGPARQAMRKAGYLTLLGAVTINKLCWLWHESGYAGGWQSARRQC